MVQVVSPVEQIPGMPGMFDRSTRSVPVPPLATPQLAVDLDVQRRPVRADVVLVRVEREVDALMGNEPERFQRHRHGEPLHVGAVEIDDGFDVREAVGIRRDVERQWLSPVSSCRCTDRAVPTAAAAAGVAAEGAAAEGAAVRPPAVPSRPRSPSRRCRRARPWPCRCLRHNSSCRRRARRRGSSLPAPPLSVSLPAPPFSLSFPPRPDILSFPPMPLMTSLPGVPFRTSAFCVPLIGLRLRRHRGHREQARECDRRDGEDEAPSLHLSELLPW